jgi:tetratricopeptide (TPR) repeat protein
MNPVDKKKTQVKLLARSVGRTFTMWALLVRVSVAGIATFPTATHVQAQRIATEDNTGAKVLLHDSGKWEYTRGKQGAKNEAGKSGESLVASEPAGPLGLSPAEKLVPFLTTERMIMAGIVLVMGGGSLLFFLVVQPARRRKPLLQALRIISSGQTEMYEEAEELLARAITAGLKKKDIQEAFFARAYIRAQLGIFDRAMADLKETERQNPAVAYLEMWLLVQRGEYKEAYAVYAENMKAVELLENGKRLVSIVCFNLGKQYWKEKRIEEALKRFEEVKALGVHAEKVPGSIDEHHITFGLLSLFDNDYVKAESDFRNAVERAKKNGSSTLQAELGLLLCKWRKGGHPPADEEVGKLAARVENQLSKAPIWSRSEASAIEGEDKEEGAEAQRALTEHGLLLRNVLLCHAVSLVHMWISREAKSGLPRSERDRLEERTHKVNKVDDGMTEPRLLLGLIDYYLFHDSMKESGLGLLEDSKTNVPEVGLIIEREKKLKELEKDRLKTFLALAKEYLSNPDIPVQMRSELKKALGRYARFKEVGELKISEQAIEDGGATIQGLQFRSALLRKRIGTIVKPLLASTDSSKAKSIDDLMSSMENASETIRQNAASLEKSELNLMINSGDLVLKEESLAEQLPAGPRPADILSKAKARLTDGSTGEHPEEAESWQSQL